eukprot:jgi/Psemu1/60418/gm1.60418_g
MRNLRSNSRHLSNSPVDKVTAAAAAATKLADATPASEDNRAVVDTATASQESPPTFLQNDLKAHPVSQGRAVNKLRKRKPKKSKSKSKKTRRSDEGQIPAVVPTTPYQGVTGATLP